MLDFLVRGGTVVDGSGNPSFRADIGIRAGRIVEIGRVEESAARTIDADGLVVAPGFVDIHTHYDCQITWDPMASPSTLHGVTTIVGGNCGFTIAPLKPNYADYLVHMMARVEGMPIEALKAGLSWDWSSYEHWLARFEGNVGPNAGFLVGHCPLRLHAMGSDAIGSEATAAQLEEITAGLRRALEAGALGFSTTLASTHNDASGRPVPSRWCSQDELLTLATITGEYPGTTIELVPERRDTFPDDETEFLIRMSRAADRPLNWNSMRAMNGTDTRWRMQMRASERAAAAGAAIVALTATEPSEGMLSALTGFVLDSIAGWAEVFGLPPAQRIKALADPATRERMKDSEPTGARHIRAWNRLRIVETFAPENAGIEGKTLGEIAAERGQDLLDVFFDIIVADELRTGIVNAQESDDEATWQIRLEQWRSPHTIVGVSDAGAHGDIMCGAAYTSAFLAEAVRERRLLPLEEAIHHLTDAPARLYGLKHRGRVSEGWWADLAIFDPGTIGAGRPYRRTDLPGGAWRYYRDATGVEHVLVNGVPIVSGGRYTGTRPGKVLRSGADTVTVTARQSQRDR